MEDLSRIKVSLAYAGKTGILLTGQLGKDPVTDSKWCKNTIGSGDRYDDSLIHCIFKFYYYLLTR